MKGCFKPMGLFKSIFGDYSSRELKSIYPIVDKVEALAELVRELNPDAQVETCRLRIDAANVDELVARCPLWLEALDGAADKRLLAAASPVPRAWAALAANPCKSACWAIWCWWATSRPTSLNIRPWPRA